MNENSINGDSSNTLSKMDYVSLWFDWLTGSSITIVDMHKNVLGYCSDTKITWSDFKKYGRNLCINDYLIDKLTIFINKGVHSNYKLNNTIWCTFDGPTCKKMLNVTDIHRILYYVDSLKIKENFNMFDLQLCGLILGGCSIVCSRTGTYWHLDLQIRVE